MSDDHQNPTPPEHDAAPPAPLASPAQPEPDARAVVKDALASQASAARDVFARALRDMLVLVGALAVVGVVAGYLVADLPGVWGALIGVGVTLVFSGTTVISMLKTADSGPTTLGAVILGAWLGKMVVLVAVFALLSDRTFYDKIVFVVVVLVGVLGSALLDYRAVQQGRVPYVEPTPRG